MVNVNTLRQVTNLDSSYSISPSVLLNKVENKGIIQKNIDKMNTTNSCILGETSCIKML